MLLCHSHDSLTTGVISLENAPLKILTLDINTNAAHHQPLMYAPLPNFFLVSSNSQSIWKVQLANTIWRLKASWRMHRNRQVQI
eukprot:m.332363 g.332363  ORF g.332363 m.332363 type:complete len:84 (-) comp16939_c0_seq1:50-301(-)